MVLFSSHSQFFFTLSQVYKQCAGGGWLNSCYMFLKIQINVDLKVVNQTATIANSIHLWFETNMTQL